MWHGVDGMGWWMLWGGFMMVLFWAAVIGAIVWGIQASTRSGDGARTRPSEDKRREPLEIVKERYARGEISREEFERIKSDLMDT